MKTDNIQYDDFIQTRSISLPQILSLNTQAMNRVEADMTTSIQKKMEDYKSKAIEIRLGTLTGSYFLYDRGPALSCRVIPVSSVNTKLENSFSTAGINQTLHQIYLHVEVTVEILLPGFSAQTTVKSDYAIAQTIILGPSPTYILGNQVVKP